jgi:hypothetical protein
VNLQEQRPISRIGSDRVWTEAPLPSSRAAATRIHDGLWRCLIDLLGASASLYPGACRRIRVGNHRSELASLIATARYDWSLFDSADRFAAAEVGVVTRHS